MHGVLRFIRLPFLQAWDTDPLQDTEDSMRLFTWHKDESWQCKWPRPEHRCMFLC